MSLLNANAEWITPSKTSRVWLGEGLGLIPKRVHDEMLRWEYVDMADFLPRSAVDWSSSELETKKLVVIPGFEVSQTRKKPVANIVMWVHGSSVLPNILQQWQNISQTAHRDS